MDPLSDVLSLLKLNSFWSAGFEAGGPWSLAFDRSEGIRFYAAVFGECWVAVDGIAEPAHISAGDCIILPRGRPFRVASDLALEPINPLTTFPDVLDGGVTCYNGGGDFSSIGGDFTLTGDYANGLIEMLPPIVHIRRDSDKAVLRRCIEQMRHELREPQPGGSLVAQQLAMMILIQALRLHLAQGRKGGVGWLFALSDKHMAAAISAMHHEPARRWTVKLLAECAGMSRTTFALKFRDFVGASPMEYLTRWRMMLAADRLTNSSDPMSAIARSLGYESESAFSTAFKRTMSRSPREYARASSVSHPSL